MPVRPVRSGTRRTSSAAELVPAAARHLLQAMPVPAALLSRDGYLAAVNQAWTAAATPAGLMSTRDEPGTDHLTDLDSGKGFAHDAGQAVAAIIRTALTDGPQSTAYVLNDADRPAMWIAHAESLDLDGQQYVLLTHQERTSEEKSQSLAEQLSTTSMDLKRVMAVAQDRSHLLHGALQEFHGPITPINLQLHLLSTGGLGKITKRQATALERIQRNVRRWWNLQEKLLGQLQGLERNDEMPRLIDLGSLLDEALPPFRDRCLASGIRLRIDRPKRSVPVQVSPRALVQVMLMLVDHAIKVTSSGGQVWVRARAVGDHAELSIQDQDPVMDPNIAQHLLDKDQLLTEHDDGGHALRSGLLYAHSVVARIGGTLEVHCSGPGQGLEVVLSLPQSLGL